MRVPVDTLVTAEPVLRASVRDGWAQNASGPAGVWTLNGDGLIASDADGPATVLVPTEAVLLLAVDLPIANRAKRLAALPFAIEDRIVDPVDAVHLAIGAELSPKRFLVGVVRHERMAEWIARIEEAGLDHAALVPDALALPRPGESEWAVDLGSTRAVVRRGDGTGFAVPAPVLRTAWEAGGRPAMIGYGAPLPDDMRGGDDLLDADPLGRRLLAPALDLRQGVYARRRRSAPGVGKRLAQIAALGVLAHAGIATADTILLRGIADKRARETQALVMERAPGTNLSGDDLAGTVADLLPPPGAGGGVDAFLPAVTRISGALAPLAGQVPVRTMSFQGNVLTIEVDSSDPALGARVTSALRDAAVPATVTTGASGIRITASAA